MRTSRLLAAAATAALLVALTACSGSGSSGSTASADTALVEGGEAGGAAGAGSRAAASVPEAAGDLSAQDSDGKSTGGTDPASYQSTVTPGQQALIKTGSVSLRSDDVAQTRFDVQELIDGHEGTVSDDRTETDKSGTPVRSRMVLRVPVAEYDDVMDQLGKLATLSSTSSTSEDVTTQLIDVQARIAVQTQSVRRVRQLLTRAESIRDIMAIESELASRQADLDSLSQQQAWLTDQTSMATIRVHLERTPSPAAKKAEHRTGFLAGLSSGWHGLARATTAALTALGALLPFAVVLLLVGLPTWLLVSRLRRRSAPAEATPVTD